MKVTQYLLPLFAALVFGFNTNAQSDLVLGVGGVATLANENISSSQGFTFNVMAGNHLSAVAVGYNSKTNTFSFTYMLPARQRFNAPKAWLGVGAGFTHNRTITGNVRFYHQNGNIVFGGGVDTNFSDRVIVAGSIGYNIHRKVR